MAELDFPDPSESPWTDPNGRQWEHDGDGWACATGELVANARYGLYGLGGNDVTLDRSFYSLMPGFSTLWSELDITITVPLASVGGFTPGDSITFTHWYQAPRIFTFDVSALTLATLPPGKQAVLSEYGKSVTIVWVSDEYLIMTGDWDDA